MKEGKLVMNRLLDRTHKVYKVRHKKSGKFLNGRPPTSLEDEKKGEIYDTPASPKRSYAQRNKYWDLADRKWEEFEVVEYELVEVGIV